MTYFLHFFLTIPGILMQLWEMQESHCKDRKDKMTKTWVKTNTKTYKTKNWRTKE